MVAGVGVLGVVFIRKYATLRVLDPDTSRSIREKSFAIVLWKIACSVRLRCT